MYSIRRHVSNGATFGNSVFITGEAGRMRAALPTCLNSDPEDGDRSYPRNVIFCVLFVCYQFH
jgi:thiamine monophosphate kinase